jgi:GTPase-associated protein 1, N-terminal domain type 2
MAQDLIEQAVFSSKVGRTVSGYHLVARSPGINEEVAGELSRWSPSHGALPGRERNAVGYSFFRLGPRRLAIGRTVHGLPEYSGRGGLQVFTRYLVVSQSLFESWGCDATRFMLLARSQGWLQWEPGIRNELPALTATAKWALRDPPHRIHGLQPLFERMKRHLKAGDRVAVIGADYPYEVLQMFLQGLDATEKCDLSFGAGLKPAADRAFRLQLFRDLGIDERDSLVKDHVTALRYDPV